MSRKHAAGGVRTVTMRPTVYVRYKDGGHEAYVAEEDFDKALHERLEPPAEEPDAAPAEEGAEGAGDGDGAKGAEEEGAVLPADYDEKNAGEIIALIGDLEDVEAVKAIAHYEEANSKRKTVAHAAEKRIEELEADDSG